MTSRIEISKARFRTLVRQRETNWLDKYRAERGSSRLSRQPFGQRKESLRRDTKLVDELRQLLEKQWDTTQSLQQDRGIICPWVFHRNGKPIKSFYAAWHSACKKAGLPGRIPHDFRRTAVRNLIRSGVPELVAMQLTGHRSRSVFRRYHIIVESDLVEAAQKLDQAAKG